MKLLPQIKDQWMRMLAILLGVFAVVIMGLSVTGSAQTLRGEAAHTAATSSENQAQYINMVALEGVGEDSLKGGSMPVLSRLVEHGSVTWSAAAVNPPLRLPTMASLFTGLPVEKHGVTWNNFDFIRGYPRPPTVFDYLETSGGRDSAIFFMDESLYQLAKPEPYTDYQVCGRFRPECNTAAVVRDVRDYFRKATSGDGYNHMVSSLPHFLVIHLPEPGRAGEAHGWDTEPYRVALRTVDDAMGAILDLYQELGLREHTVMIVTTLSGNSEVKPAASGSHSQGDPPRVLWVASGPGIKEGYVIKGPVSILDTGATVLRMLGLETYTEWQSRAVEEIFTAPRLPAANRTGGSANAR